MNRLTKLTVFLFVAFTLTLPVFGQMGGGMMGGGGTGGGMMGDSSVTGGGMMGGKAGDMMNRGKEMRNSQGMMGMGFMHSDGNSYGDYVTFSVDNNTGAVMDYGISGVTVFNSIRITNFNFKDSATMGALTRITNKDGSVIMQLHDNPAAVINIGTKVATTVTFSLADGVKASKEDDIIKIEAGDLTGYIAPTNASSVNIAGGEIRIESNGGENTVFRAEPVNMPMDTMNQRFMGEMIGNRAGAEVSVGVSDKYSIVNYSGNMNVMIKSMERNHMRMVINSTDHSGKFIIMNLDNSSFMWNQRQKVNFYLDNKPMRHVMTADELYTARDSSFWLTMPGGNRMEAMMYIANFSEHVVDISVEEVAPTPAGASETKTPVSTPATPGFEVVLGLLGAGLAYHLKRR